MKSNSFLAFVSGAILGGAAALLLAPKSGKETRKKIKKILKEEKDKLDSTIDSAKERLGEVEEKFRKRPKEEK